MKLPVKLQNKIIEFLIELPTMHDSDSQRAFIYHAGLDLQLQNQIQFGKPPTEFVPLLVSKLLKYGKLNDGQDALKAVLKAAKHYIGHDRKAYCESLLNEVHTVVTRSETESSESRTFQSYYKVVIIAFCLLAVLFWVYGQYQKSLPDQEKEYPITTSKAYQASNSFQPKWGPNKPNDEPHTSGVRITKGPARGIATLNNGINTSWPGYGNDERAFLIAINSHKSDAMSDITDVLPGQRILLKYVINNNGEISAEGVRVHLRGFHLNDGEWVSDTVSTFLTLTGVISGENITPKEIWDETIIRNASNLNIRLRLDKTQSLCIYPAFPLEEDTFSCFAKHDNYVNGKGFLIGDKDNRDSRTGIVKGAKETQGTPYLYAVYFFAFLIVEEIDEQ